MFETYKSLEFTYYANLHIASILYNLGSKYYTMLFLSFHLIRTLKSLPGWNLKIKTYHLVIKLTLDYNQQKVLISVCKVAWELIIRLSKSTYWYFVNTYQNCSLNITKCRFDNQMISLNFKIPAWQWFQSSVKTLENLPKLFSG